MWLKKPDYIASVSIYVNVHFFFIAISYLCLTFCFLTNDFSVWYVLNNSSLSLPWFYKLCAVWGGHEGSMLLWVAILSVWMLGVNFFSDSLPQRIRSKVLVILGVISAGFILFLLATSNPFLRQFQILDSVGRDLNPLLQDPGFLFHPPMLYMGYVGFSVAFAFALAALWEGKIESAWAKWTRPWTLAAWCCLTTGITLGSWWAYRELGWGGWWFWDPVENASFMPWLVGTALIHSLAVSEQRQQFKAWTLLLAISAFSLSLIGTFLVRSGVLTSVHAFAVDPARGLYILLFLLFVIGGSLTLFAFRVQTVKNHTRPALFSKESALLLNNVFLVVAMLTVLLGTTYPLLIDGLGLGKLSVGAPYFNTVFIPLMIPLFLLMGLGIHLRWGEDNVGSLFTKTRNLIGIAVAGGCFVLYFFAPHVELSVLVGVILSSWIFVSTFNLILRRVKERGFDGINQAFWGMVTAHFGVAITVIGISVSTGYGIVKDVRLAPGESVQMAGYLIQFGEERELNGPNYHGTQARFLITSKGKEKTIYPEKRIYNIGQMPMTDAAIDANPFRDIYIALAEPVDDNAWAVRIYYKPFIRWIWGGGFFILFGGVIALSDRRYYLTNRKIAKKHEVVYD